MSNSHLPFSAGALGFILIVGIVAILITPISPFADTPAPSSSTPSPENNGDGSPDNGVYVPDILKPASDEALQIIPSFILKEGFKTRLFAAEPMVANPVAFHVDPDGRVFVAETFRQGNFGVPDNRDHPYWVDDDYAATSVDDRRAMYLKHHPEYAEEWLKEHDRIRILRDDNGDGEADRSTVFADGFNDILDGTGAGVMSDGANVWYTCIPHLWLLKDTDGDDRADHRSSLHGTGYGVRVALRGHDMHGLVWGPDGKIYYSIGDRGYNVTTADGKNFRDPASGAVFRCNPDGSDLEIFATGLRNPQELAFDDFGNLVTGDNNSDSDDEARIVHVVEGAEIGWRMNFQTLPRRGPWVREHWWKPRFKGQAAFLTPPLANLGNGPSGLSHYPGTGLPSEYDGCFLMCDFRGGRRPSGVRAFHLETDGATLRLGEHHWFVKNTLPTDVTFGPAGQVWISDWVDGWDGLGKGRIYTIAHETASLDPVVQETFGLLRDGLSEKTMEELALLLGHKDRRIRRGAQFEMASRPPTAAHDAFAGVAQKGTNLLSRIHAVWGLGQVGRRLPEAHDLLVTLLADPDGEIRAQAARVVGDARWKDAYARLAELTSDPEPRAKFYGALALGRIGGIDAFDLIVDMIRTNGGRDHYIRHAGVMALWRFNDADRVHALGGAESASIRMAAVLALRRFRDPRLSEYLQDQDPLVAVEAARAIYDLPISEALPDVAAMLGRVNDPAFVRRAVGAREILGGPSGAAALAEFAADRQGSGPERVLALRSLLEWRHKRLRERVLNDHRPREGRDPVEVTAALTPYIKDLLRSGTEDQRATEEQSRNIRRLAASIAGDYGIMRAKEPLNQLLRDSTADVSSRETALRSLQSLKADSLETAATFALNSGQPELRARGAAVIAELDPERAVSILESSMVNGAVPERQLGISSLARIGSPRADAALQHWTEKYLEENANPEIALELMNACRKRAGEGNTEFDALVKRWESGVTEPLGRHVQSLHGGRADRGRRIFLEKSETSCRRCHVVSGIRKTEMAGPDLSDAGIRLNREQILRSIVNPNLEVAEGFESVTLVTNRGKVYTGQILEETADAIRIEYDSYGEVEHIQLEKTSIRERRKASSAMPADLIEKLNPSELRDVVEFLSTQREKREDNGH